MTPSPPLTDRAGVQAPEVHALVWLPLAVRYKLDVIGCRLRLAQWQRRSRRPHARPCWR